MSRNQRMIALVVAALVVVTVCHGFQPPPPISGAVVGVGPGFAPMQRGSGLAVTIATPTWNSVPYALIFDGADDIASGSGAGLPLGASASTLMCWIKPLSPGLPASKFFMHIGNNAAGSNYSRRDIGINTGNFMLSHYYGDIIYNATATEKWDHVAVTYSQSAFISSSSVYVNGNLVSIKTIVNGAPTTSILNTLYGSMWLGNNPTHSEAANCKLAEAAVFNRALTQAEIQAYYPYRLTGTEPGLLRLYHCDEGAGNSLTDAAGSGYSMTLLNGATWTTRL